MKTRRSLFVIGILGCVLLVFFGAHFFAQPVAAAQGDVVNIFLFDDDHNGYIDRATFDIENGSLETWSKVGVAPYGISVNRGGDNIAVTSVTVTNPSDAYVTIEVGIDQAELAASYSPDTDASAVEVVYTVQGGGAACTNCIRSGATQSVGIANGDGNANNIESDSAPPVMITSTTEDQNSDGIIDNVTLALSESTYFGDGESAFADVFDLVGDICTPTVSGEYPESGYTTSYTFPVDVSGETDTACVITAQFRGEDQVSDGSNSMVTFADPIQGGVDGAHPVAYRTVARDQNKDGTLDKLDVYFSESVDITDGGTQLESTLSLAGSVNHLSNACTPSIISGAYAASAVTLLTLDISTVEQDTGCIIPVTITAEGNILDVVDLSVANGITSATVEEDAPPVLLSVSPEPDQTDIAVDSPIALVFSEAMESGFVYNTEFTSSPNPAPGTWGGSWSDEYHLQLTPNGNFSAGTLHTITLVPAQIIALGGTTTALLTVGTALDESWSFTTAGEGGGGGGGSNQVRVPPTRPLAEGIEVKEPTTQVTLDAGTTVLVKWVPVGEGRIDAVNISWSADGGLTWEEIAHNRPNGNGSYAWKVPARSTDAGLIRVEATDLAAPYASDVSNDYFSIQVPGVRLPDADAFTPGALIKAEGLPAVYYLAEDNTRRPFPDERVFQTWFKNFDEVREVPLHRIARYRMGAPMLPKPGTAFLQINSDPKLYWIDRVDNRAHWIKSESTASLLAGPQWREMIIDLGATIFPSVLFGVPVE